MQAVDFQRLDLKCRLVLDNVRHGQHFGRSASVTHRRFERGLHSEMRAKVEIVLTRVRNRWFALLESTNHEKYSSITLQILVLRLVDSNNASQGF